jgi:phosphohistidine swiveling domain-containing protein
MDTKLKTNLGALGGVLLFLLLIGYYDRDTPTQVHKEEAIKEHEEFVTSFQIVEIIPDLPVIEGYDNPTVDDLPPLTLDGSHLPIIDGYEPLEVHELPNLED